jgi:integrase
MSNVALQSTALGKAYSRPARPKSRSAWRGEQSAQVSLVDVFMGGGEGLDEDEPVRDVKKIKYSTDGFHTWTVAEIRKFEERWPIGSKPRLAMALLRYTGARRGDMATFGRQHVRDGFLTYVPNKTKCIRMDASQKPILPELKRIVEASPCGELTFLVTSFGRPFTAAGFGNWFREQCDLAGLPKCSAHGLKKAAATAADEEGATDRQLMAIFDWSTASQANVYTKKAREEATCRSGHVDARRQGSERTKKGHHCRTLPVGGCRSLIKNSRLV